MTRTPRPADASHPHRSDDRQRWAAALVTALLHGLLIWLAMLAMPVTVSDPQGADAGGALQVVYIDETLQPPPPTPAPAQPDAPTAPAATRVQTTLVTDAADPVPPDTDTTADTPAPPRARAAAQPRRPPAPTPPAPPVDAPPTPAPAPVASTAQPIPRPAYMRGQPPGMLPRAAAPAGTGAGPSARASTGSGRGSDRGGSGTSLEVGGYQVIYELISEDLLRNWRDEGITELFLPLPGTRRLMVCPLEVALRRGSSECRMVEPNDPELATIGDAREVLLMQRVYRMGQALWRGPGAYR